MTVAPPQRASCAAIEPTPPRTPCTRTGLPSTGPSANTARWAVIPGMPRLAPSSSLTWSGSGTARSAGYDGVLGGGPEGPVGLGAVDPHPLSDAALVDALADGVDDAGRVAVRDHPRVGHRGAEPAAPLLGVAGVDTGEAHPNADLARAGVGVRAARRRWSTSAAGPCRSYQDASMRTSVALSAPGPPGVCGVSVRPVPLAPSGGASFRTWCSQARSARLVARAIRSMPRR